MASPVPNAGTFTIPQPGDTSPVLERKVAAYIAEGLGKYGADAFTGPVTVSNGPYAVLHALTDIVIGAITGYRASTSGLAGKTLKAGDRITVPFSSITVSSGDFIVYKAAPQ